MIPELGLLLLIIAFVFSLLLFFTPFFFFFTSKQRFSLAYSLVTGNVFFLIASFLILVACFITNDFSVQYVAHNSHTNLPLLYKGCAIWGGHEGSLLLWALVLALWSFCAARVRNISDVSLTQTLSILGGIQGGFLLLLLYHSNPFSRILPFAPSEGIDLNPLLQDPGFVLHPPFLYIGYVGFALPFAFALSALIQGDKTIAWAGYCRSFALLAWSFLTVGITLGSWWAYYELGWGGWWFWDPVENASFMPWLMGGALVHALYLFEKRGLYPAWTLLLAICVFLLSLIGTFLVRSGVLSSVHAFATDPGRGAFILSFLAVVTFLALGFYLYRVPSWSRSSGSHFFSKESLILCANIIWVVGTLTVLLGTLYPIFLQLWKNETISVGPPYFNEVFIPLMLPMFFIMIFAPHLHWKMDSFKKLYTRCKSLFWGGLAMISICFFCFPTFSLFSKLGILLGVGIIGSSALKLRFSSWTQFCKPFGMVLSHIGLGVSLLGIALVPILEEEQERVMKVGESAQVGDYTFVFRAIHSVEGKNYQGRKAHFIIQKQTQLIGEIYPEKRFFIPRQIPMSETAIHATFLRDFYVALGEPLAEASWSVRLYIKPFIRWIWFGGLMIALGTFITALYALKKEQLH